MLYNVTLIFIVCNFLNTNWCWLNVYGILSVHLEEDGQQFFLLLLHFVFFWNLT